MSLQPNDSVSLQLPDGAGGGGTLTTAPVGPGFAAALGATNWDGTAVQPHRLLHSRGGTFETFPAEPDNNRNDHRYPQVYLGVSSGDLQGHPLHPAGPR